MSTKKQSSQNDSSDIQTLITERISGVLHHCYIIGGDVVSVPEIVREILRARNDETFDCIHFSYESLLVEDAMLLRARAYEHAQKNAPRYVLISALSITKEAQNALLKIFEEPASHVHFFLIIPNEHILLPTLRSRAIVFSVKNNVALPDTIFATAHEFLKVSRGARLEMIATLIKKYDDTETSGPRRQAAIDLLSALEQILSADVVKNQESLTQILKAKSYLASQGALVKMILEHIALILP